jgi:hypothetical protein
VSFFFGKVIGEKVCPWRDSAMSSCKEIGSNELDGLPRVILSGMAVLTVAGWRFVAILEKRALSR